MLAEEEEEEEELPEAAARSSHLFRGEGVSFFSSFFPLLC